MTVPSHPQDALASALAALTTPDPAEAWARIDPFLAAQWPDGMIPHLIYHEPSEAFPPSGLWVTGRPITTSGLTAMPLLGTVLRRLHDMAPDPARIHTAMTIVDRWHGWFGTHRDPHGTGLVAILHPWESGRPTSSDWEVPFARVPTEGVAAYLPEGAGPAQARAVWLIERFRSLGWETPELHDTSPFCVIDPGLNAVLIRSCDDLAALADALDAPEIAEGNRAIAARIRDALTALHHDGRYLPFDRIAGHALPSTSVGTILPRWAGLPVAAAAEDTEPWATTLLDNA